MKQSVDNKNTHRASGSPVFTRGRDMAGRAVVSVSGADMSACRLLPDDVGEGTIVRIELEPGVMVSMIDVVSLTAALPAALRPVIVADGLGDRAAAIVALCDNPGPAVYLRADCPAAATDVLILASLGIDTGLVFSPSTQLSEEMLSLVTYQFYSTRPHGAIEPWATMASERRAGRFVTPAVACGSVPRNEDEGNGGLTRWQQLLLDCGDCSFCPAMRLCEGFFACRENHDDCRRLMSEVQESINFSINNTLCQP